MIVAIPATGEDLTAEIDPRFGRAGRFLIVDTDTDEIRVVENVQNLSASQGAGIQSAKGVLDAGATDVLTAHVGPKAFSTLSAGGARIYTGLSGSAGDALAMLTGGKLKPAAGADVQGHWA
jgi:predicted Fe-Mo cluster-binding NifX family protein